MSWNESGNGQRGPRRGDGQRPADLDKIVRDWQRKLSAAFGGGRGGRGGGSRAAGGGPGTGGSVALLVVAVVAWGLTGFYRVDQAERGLVLRFGDHVRTALPGLRWHLPFPIETVEKVNVSQVNTFEKKNQMLTADEAFVVVGMAVQYRRTDPVDYLFNVREQEQTVEQVSESAIREVVGKSTLDYILQENQQDIADRTQALIQETLESYESGIEVVSVNLQQVEFPDEVRDAVQDAVKAREDQRTFILQAQVYQNDIVPRARGQAQRQIEDAEAYRERITANAQGDAARFGALLSEYQKAPRVTRDRLYIETLEQVMQTSNKVLIDTDGSGNLTVLPLEQLMKQRELNAAAVLSRPGETRDNSEESRRSATPSRNDGRRRGNR
ncbi:MAG: FtsH protease activity modulator HflK [Pseudomonadota bacterium]